MTVLKCDECGCHIPSEKVFKRIDGIQEEGMMSEEEAEKSKEKIKQGNPYVKCHNPDCSGFLQPVEKDEVQADPSRLKLQR